MAQNGHRNIVIIGGGIIGCTIAYYLSRHPSYSLSTTNVTVLEASSHGVAQGASGKAGGLVAKWAYPREIVDISFPEHVRLANEHNGKKRWGWRFVDCGNWEGRGEDLTHHVGAEVGMSGERKSLEKKARLETSLEVTPQRTQSGHPDGLNWLHPYLFTTSMMDLAVERGATLLRGSATTIEREHGCVTGVRYKDSTGDSSRVIPATHVILAAGAWSPSIVPSLSISATRAHSVTVHPDPDVIIAPYVLFTEITLPRGQMATPEIYARPGNEIYACGPGDDSPLPESVDDVDVDQAACQSVWEHVASISAEFREGTLAKRQACFLPVANGSARPIVGEAPKIAKGLYIATGHTCWGICNAPGTARVITELVMDGRIRSGNVTNLEPSLFLSCAQ